VYLSAKAEYATRALLTLAAAGDQPVKGEVLAREQRLPFKFLENTLVTRRQAGLIRTQRGPDGGYRLARPAASITVADILRPLDGPLADVRGEKPEEAVYDGPATHLQDVWIAVLLRCATCSKVSPSPTSSTADSRPTSPSSSSGPARGNGGSPGRRRSPSHLPSPAAKRHAIPLQVAVGANADNEAGSYSERLRRVAIWRSAWTRQSTSARVLYMASDGRTVASSP